jgi:hypothetical protein
MTECVNITKNTSSVDEPEGWSAFRAAKLDVVPDPRIRNSRRICRDYQGNRESSDRASFLLTRQNDGQARNPLARMIF